MRRKQEIDIMEYKTKSNQLNYKIMMDTDHDNTGIHYSHLSQRVGGEIQLQKLKRRRKNENRHSK